VSGLPTQPLLIPIVQCAQSDQDVLAVILFGSAARGEARVDSDLDVCLILEPRPYPSVALTEKRLEYMTAFPVDVQVFQALPLYIRQRILQEGHVLFCRDQERLYALALRTVQAFADFRPLYRRYLEEVARA